jgi:hypothetical protein
VTARRQLTFGIATPYLNLSRDPRNPFVANATLLGHAVSSLNNTGEDIRSWAPFGALQADGSVYPVNLILGGTCLQPEGTTNIHQIVSLFDPITGQSRIILGDDQGIYTGVARPDGSIDTGIGTASTVIGNRNGDLQVAQLYYGAAQPSILAAQLAGAFLYGTAQDYGPHAQSAGNLMSSGNIDWLQPFENPLGTGAGVATDQTGSGTSYHYVWPSSLLPLSDPVTTNFFEVTPPGGAPISRTTGLPLVNGNPGGGLGSTPDPEWDFRGGSAFAVIPINNQQIVMSSSGGTNAGRIFRTFDQGLNWAVIGNPGDLDSTYAQALAYGAPDPGAPAGVLDNFIYAGTVGGHIFVTFGGGGNGTTNQWTNITNGDLTSDGSSVMRISADPVRGTHDAYAVTRNGVYYNPDVRSQAWQKITGNLFSLTFNPFGDPTATETRLQYLTALAVDWRDQIPFTPVQSLTSSGTTATVTTVSPHGFRTGDQITISGANEPGYNGTFTVTVDPAVPNAFTYQVGTPLQVQSITFANGLATVTTAAPHKLTSGIQVIIGGADQAAYNGTFAVTVTGTNTFTYPVSGTPASPATGTLSAIALPPSPATGTIVVTPASLDRPGVHPTLYVGGEGGVYRSRDNGRDWTVFPDTVSASQTDADGGPGDGSPVPGGYLPNAHITDLSLSVGNLNPQTGQPDQSYATNTLVVTTYGRGQFAINLPLNDQANLVSWPRVVSVTPTIPVSTPPGLSTVTVTFAGTVNPASFNAGTAAIGQAFQVQSLTQSGGVATVTTVNAHGLTTGDQVVIVGADQASYNGTFTITATGPNAFTYAVSGNPASPATGAVTALAINAARSRATSVAFGPSLQVQSITQTGGVATVTTAAAHNLSTGATVVIEGADQLAYDGTFTVTVTGTNTFTYAISGNPASPATGNVTAVVPITVSQPLQVQSITAAGGLATVTTTNAHGLTTGIRVIISGADQAAYDGTFTATVTGTNTFTFPIGGNPVPATGTISAIPLTTLTDVSTPGADGINRHNSWQIIFPTQSTYGNYTLVVGPNVTDFAGHAMDQNQDGVNGEAAVFPTGDQYVHTFTIAGLAVQSAAAVATAPVQVQAITSPAGVPATTTTKTATVTTVTPHGFVNGQEVLIQGANESGYDGLVTITVLGPNTFTYQVASSLPPAATGTITAEAAYAPGTPVPTPPGLGAIYLTFNTSVAPNTFDASQVALSRVGSGAITGLTVTELPGGCAIAHACWQINLPSSQLKPGIYSLAVGPGIMDTFGHAMDQNQNGTYRETPGDIYTTTWAVPGVHVVSTTPASGSPVVNPATLSTITVTFSGDITGSTLTSGVPGSTVQLLDPNGNAVGPLTFTNESAAGHSNVWQIGLPTETLPGVYTLSIGPNVLDTTGSPMDQNQNGILGEAADVFVGHLVLQGLQVTSAATLAGTTSVTLPSAVPMPAGLTTLTVNFNMAVNPASLTGNVVLKDPAGNVVPFTLPPVDVSSAGNNSAFKFTFAPLKTYGNYTLTVGPNVTDSVGDGMNQNGNAVFGEAGDAFTTSFAIDGLQVTSPQVLTGPIVNPSSLSSITVNFNMAVSPTSFNSNTVVLTDPNGNAIAYTATDLTGANGLHNSWQLTFPAVTTAGVYTLTVGPNVKDLAGNSMDQNETGAPTNTPFVAHFVVTGLQVTSVTPAPGSLVAGGSITTLTVNFNMAVDPTTLTSKTVVLKDPNGNQVPLTFPPADVTTGGGTGMSFQFTFPTQTGSGIYTLTVGPNVKDTIGDAMNQNGNATFGEATDAFTSTFVIPGVMVTGVTDANGIAGSTAPNTGSPILSPSTLSAITINFSAPVDASSVNSSTIKLVAPNGLAIAPVTFTDASGGHATAFTMTFPAQTTPGVYMLTVGPNVKDTNGHRMDQTRTASSARARRTCSRPTTSSTACAWCRSARRPVRRRSPSARRRSR